MGKGCVWGSQGREDLKEGEVVRARVLNHNRLLGVVELSLKPTLLQKPSKKTCKKLQVRSSVHAPLHMCIKLLSQLIRPLCKSRSLYRCACVLSRPSQARITSVRLSP